MHRFEQHSALALHRRPLTLQHWPLTQPPPEQTFPQVPQLLGSVCRSTQRLGFGQKSGLAKEQQAMWVGLGWQTVLAGQQIAWVPAPQQNPSHGKPHPPQLFRSASRLTQTPPQQPGKPAAGHCEPHFPQFLRSVCRFLQVPPQQVGEPAGHCVLHCPQFFGSVCRFTQAPLHAV
jgi:hypothetical protein